MGWICLIIILWIFGACMETCLHEILDELRKMNMRNDES